MNMCETCKFWVKEDDIFDDLPDDAFRQCTRAIDLAHSIDWPPNGDRMVRSGIKENEFGSSDYENYKSKVITGPKFGCVLHEGR
ncbi:hypothetical protein M0R72_08590 [Candidatus Pacearchaeota archaeon]|jgi:hypothetical protein|nr:hypothetical protein [Candidatus Pacearchaeota archaeon]